MNIWLRRSLQGLVLTGGFVVMGATAAHASDTLGKSAPALGITSATHALSGGTTGVAPVNLPVSGLQNATAGIGKALTTKAHAQPQRNASKAAGKTSGAGSLLGGNLVQAPVNAPVAVANNAIAVLGLAHSAGDTHGAAGSSAAAAQTNGSHSILGGNIVQAPINAPITVSHNAVAVAGIALAGNGGGANGGGAPAAAAQTDGAGSVGGGATSRRRRSTCRSPSPTTRSAATRSPVVTVLRTR
ncbi:chaplin family protein [Fodinicola feengrottensis]|uniref:chaplin family protein n=1 Tax=Fodinicola feengrottensis TaxID=435914 RepID=UPI0013D18F03|nr:chaplin family protein [Fodinicola feengrottensis]